LICFGAFFIILVFIPDLICFGALFIILVGNESEVWGRQFDRKNVKEKRSTSSETEGKKSNQYLQKLSSKLFDVSKQIGDEYHFSAC
jgi:hypothetical protein